MEIKARRLIPIEQGWGPKKSAQKRVRIVKPINQHDRKNKQGGKGDETGFPRNKVHDQDWGGGGPAWGGKPSRGLTLKKNGGGEGIYNIKTFKNKP